MAGQGSGVISSRQRNGRRKAGIYGLAPYRRVLLRRTQHALRTEPAVRYTSMELLLQASCRTLLALSPAAPEVRPFLTSLKSSIPGGGFTCLGPGARSHWGRSSCRPASGGSQRAANCQAARPVRHSLGDTARADDPASGWSRSHLPIHG